MSDWLFGLLTALIEYCESYGMQLLVHQPGHCGPSSIPLRDVPRERSAMAEFLRSLGIHLETWMRPEDITWNRDLKLVVRQYCDRYPSAIPEELEAHFVNATLPGCV